MVNRSIIAETKPFESAKILINKQFFTKGKKHEKQKVYCCFVHFIHFGSNGHGASAKNKLAQVEYEAQQKVTEAKGKAEAMSLEAQSLNQNPTILTLRAIEKWDGKLPLYGGSSGITPILDIGKSKQE